MSDSGDPKLDKQRELEAEREFYEHPNPKDPQAELREDLRQIFSGTMVVVQEDDLDRAVKLFQAHQQELLSELLEQRGNPADYVGVESVVPKSVIERKIGELNG